VHCHREEFPVGNARPRPKRLASKLVQIRSELGLSQAEMLRLLGVEDRIDYTTISKYELDKNEPPLEILLQYARVAGVHMEDIADDDSDLPAKLPGNVKYQRLKHPPKSRRNR
jgi:transcriptional regulator with XRE-family HTH domain